MSVTDNILGKKKTSKKKGYKATKVVEKATKKKGKKASNKTVEATIARILGKKKIVITED